MASKGLFYKGGANRGRALLLRVTNCCGTNRSSYRRHCRILKSLDLVLRSSTEAKEMLKCNCEPAELRNLHRRGLKLGGAKGDVYKGINCDAGCMNRQNDNYHNQFTVDKYFPAARRDILKIFDIIFQSLMFAPPPHLPLQVVRPDSFPSSANFFE